MNTRAEWLAGLAVEFRERAKTTKVSPKVNPRKLLESLAKELENRARVAEKLEGMTCNITDEGDNTLNTEG